MIFLTACEQSGDVLGGSLMAALKQRDSTLTFQGVGGECMKKEGLIPLLSMDAFQVMGVSDVLSFLPHLYAHFRKVQKIILDLDPSKVILIDYAEFHMLLEASLRRKGFKGKLIHYVSPSVWAWRKGRSKTLAKHVDLLLSILPFEKNYYQETSLNVKYIGHPLVKEIPPIKHSFRKWLSIFPGSRLSEIRLNLPLQLKAARRFPDYPLAISVANERVAPVIEELIQGYSCELVHNSKRYELMRESVAAIATSGTVTLELALHETPTVVTYKISPLNYYLGRYVFGIDLPYFSLANIIVSESLFPEVIEKEITNEEIARGLAYVVENGDEIGRRCWRVREVLEDLDASQEAAEAILAL